MHFWNSGKIFPLFSRFGGLLPPKHPTLYHLSYLALKLPHIAILCLSDTFYVCKLRLGEILKMGNCLSVLLTPAMRVFWCDSAPLPSSQVLELQRLQAFCLFLKIAFWAYITYMSIQLTQDRPPLSQGLCVWFTCGGFMCCLVSRSFIPFKPDQLTTFNT